MTSGAVLVPSLTAMVELPALKAICCTGRAFRALGGGGAETGTMLFGYQPGVEVNTK